MGLEERVREAWQRVADSDKSRDRVKEACMALFQLLNVPATAFNEKSALELTRKSAPVEDFIKLSDRYLPTFDTESEEKFRIYIETYQRIRGSLGDADLLAFLRLPGTPALRQKATDWLKGKGTFDWAKVPPKKV